MTQPLSSLFFGHWMSQRDSDITSLKTTREEREVKDAHPSRLAKLDLLVNKANAKHKNMQSDLPFALQQITHHHTSSNKVHSRDSEKLTAFGYLTQLHNNSKPNIFQDQKYRKLIFLFGKCQKVKPQCCGYDKTKTKCT